MAFKYAVNTNALEHLSIPEAAEFVARCGYSGIEWGLPEMDDVAAAIPQMHHAAKDNGLDVVGYINTKHLWKTDLIHRYSELVASVSGKTLRVRPAWLAYDYNESLHQKSSFNEMFTLCRQGLEKLVPLSEQYGIRYLIEMHMGMVTATAESAKQLCDGLPATAVGVIYDPGNGVTEGFTRPRHALEILGEHIGYVHAKNMIGKSISNRAQDGPDRALWEFTTCQLDAGVLDWLEVCFALKATGFTGWISMEEFFRANPETQLKNALHFLKQCEQTAPSQPQPPFTSFND